MYKKLGAILLSIICSGFISPVLANDKSTDLSKLKLEAYNTISDALFDEKIHYNMKIDIYDIINNIMVGEKPEANNQDIMEDFYKNVVEDPEKATLTIDIIEESTTETNNKPENIKLAPPDTKIIEMLRKSINSDDDNMLLYGLDSISKGKIKDLLPEVLQLLEGFNKDDYEILSSIISTLGDIGDESTVETLKKQLESGDLRVRLNALQAIGNIKCEKSDEILLNNLDNGELELALLSAGILAQDNNEKAIKLLQEGIESPVLLTNQKTMIAMSNVTNPTILPLLKTAIKSENEIVKAYALNILGKINTKESVELLTPLLDDKQLMPRALIALSKNSTPEAYKAWEQIFNSKDILKRSYALAVLTRSNSKKNIPLLKLALNDPNENIKVAAAKILHTLKDDSGIETLKSATKSKNDDISLSAAAFLGYIGNDYGEPILKNAITDTDLPSWKRLDVTIILEKLGDRSIVPSLKDLLIHQRPGTLPKDILPSEATLNDLLNSDSKWLQINTSVFMIRNKDKNCLPVLEKLSKDPDIKIRTTAVSLLGKLGSKEALNTLQDCLHDESVRVRVKSAESILKIISNPEDRTNKQEANT